MPIEISREGRARNSQECGLGDQYETTSCLVLRMEFTDPVVSQEETSENLNSKSENAPEQTLIAIERLEDEIDVAYSAVESKFSSLWVNASKSAHGLQERVKFDERKKELINQVKSARQNVNNNKVVQENVQSIEKHLKDLGEHVKSLEPNIDMNSLSSQANKALDTLDSKLEIVEQQAGKIVSLFTSFFSSIITIDTPKEAPVEEMSNAILNAKIPGAAYSQTRFDNDLFKLHTTDNFYLDESSEDENTFEIEDKTEEISKLLKEYPDTLEQTMNRLVPIQISYRDFWIRYFKQEMKLKENQQSRKELLANNEVNKMNSIEHFSDDDEDEDFTWDDDDEDDEEEEDNVHDDVDNEEVEAMSYEGNKSGKQLMESGF